MLYKILGIVLAVLGIAILKYFPDVASYQHGGMTMSGILIGVVFIIVGALLVVFG